MRVYTNPIINFWVPSKEMSFWTNRQFLKSEPVRRRDVRHMAAAVAMFGVMRIVLLFLQEQFCHDSGGLSPTSHCGGPG